MYEYTRAVKFVHLIIYIYIYIVNVFGEFRQNYFVYAEYKQFQTVSNHFLIISIIFNRIQLFQMNLMYFDDDGGNFIHFVAFQTTHKHISSFHIYFSRNTLRGTWPASFIMPSCAYAYFIFNKIFCIILL